MNASRFVEPVSLLALVLVCIGVAAWGADHIGLILGGVLFALLQI